MTQPDKPDPSRWDEPPLPLATRKPSPSRPLFQQLSLLHIMISLVYFAILFWAFRQFSDTGGYLQGAFFGVMVGVGFCLLGLWGVLKLPRFSVVGWIFFVIGYLTITASTTTFFAVPTLPIFIGSIIYLSSRRRSNQQDGLLWVLAVASDRGMPLAPGVRAFSSQVSGIYSIWVESLAELLEQGGRLPDALDDIPRLVPKGSSLLARMGWESGHLALGLREAVEWREKRSPILRSIAGRLAYLAWTSCFSLSIVGFTMYFVIPKFEAIFKDFGVELPPVTKMAIRASHVAIDYSWVPMLGLLGLLIYGLVALFGTGDRGLPLLDRVFSRRHQTLILRALSVAVEAGRPVPPAFETLARWYPTGWVRKKLSRASLDATQGIDWTEALYANGLLSASEMGVLASAQRAGNLAWAMHELAENGERRWAVRLHAWTQVLFVVVMVVFGILTLLMALAYFAPLTTLITRLTE